MKYRLWQAGWVATVLSFVIMLGLFFAAIWMSDRQLADNLGMSGMVLLFPAIFAAGGMVAWTSEYSEYERREDKPLPRADRKQLKKERARILLEKKIDELEREVRR